MFQNLSNIWFLSFIFGKIYNVIVDLFSTPHSLETQSLVLQETLIHIQLRLEYHCVADWWCYEGER